MDDEERILGFGLAMLSYLVKQAGRLTREIPILNKLCLRICARSQYGDFNHCFVSGSNSFSALAHSSLTIFARSSDRGVMLHS